MVSTTGRLGRVGRVGRLGRVGRVGRVDQAIVRSTIDLCHTLGIRVVAEGVENRQVLDRLVAMGCDMAQGYYLSHPLPMDRLLAWFDQDGFRFE